MSLEIFTYPADCLRCKAVAVTDITDDIRQLASDMVLTMYDNNGIGLAAPQVGKALRLIVLDISGPDQRTDLLHVINPMIVHAEGEVESDEGCLSVPNTRTVCKRAERIIVQGLDLDGNPLRLEADGLLAICLQHEIDHLQGTLIVDQMSRLKKSLYDNKVKKWHKIKES